MAASTLTFKLRGTSITPRHSMQFIRKTTANGVQGGCPMICAIPEEPVYSGLVISATETTTPSYTPIGGTATFDILIVNNVGVELSTLVLNASHNGGGSLSSPTMPANMVISEEATVSLTYTTSGDFTNVTITVTVSGEKPNSEEVVSNELLLLVNTEAWVEPPEEPPPP